MAFTPCFQHLFGDYTVDNDVSDEGWSKYGDVVDWLVLDEDADLTNPDLSHIVRVNISDTSDSFVVREICTECIGDADDDVIVLIKIKESRAGTFLIGIDYDSSTNVGVAVAIRPATNHFDLVRVSGLHSLLDLATASFTFNLDYWYCVRIRNNNGTLQAKIWSGYEVESGGWTVAGVAGEVSGGLALWGFGYNMNGELGLDDRIKRSSPTQVGSLTDWSKLSLGNYHALAIKTDNTLWTWGRNSDGQLGFNDRVYKSSPVQLGSLAVWQNVAGANNYWSVAIKIDGTLWAWGYNVIGQLGFNDTTSRSSPVQVGSLTTWQSICVGDFHAVAIKTDGTLWSWGLNNSGELGQNDTTSRSSPVQVGDLTDWQKVYCNEARHNFAIKTDGTLWSWGSGWYGYTAQNDIVNRSSPTQVGSLTTWQMVSVYRTHSLAVRSDGTLWAWGYNVYGQLGQNDNINRSSPIQVGSLTNWEKGAAGPSCSFGIQSNGTLWSWGGNPYGQLGSNDTTMRSSPVQVGSLTTWSDVVCSYLSVIALSGLDVGISYYDQTYKMFLGQMNEVWVDIAAVTGCIYTPISEYYLPLIIFPNMSDGVIIFPEFRITTDPYMLTGFITLDENFVERIIRLYNRSTGILLDETLSDSVDGSYYMGLLFDDDCFIVVLDDDLNALLADSITPDPIV